MGTNSVLHIITRAGVTGKQASCTQQVRWSRQEAHVCYGKRTIIVRQCLCEHWDQCVGDGIGEGRQQPRAEGKLEHWRKTMGQRVFNMACRARARWQPAQQIRACGKSSGGLTLRVHQDLQLAPIHPLTFDAGAEHWRKVLQEIFSEHFLKVPAREAGSPRLSEGIKHSSWRARTGRNF